MNNQKKKVAILQSNYIPWKGYFDLINTVDEFIFYDDVQFTKNDWRNRNKIKTSQGVQWLTIPVKHESLSQKVKDTVIADPKWNRKHWSAIVTNYSKASYFKHYKEIFEELYANVSSKYLSEVNYTFIQKICEILEIKIKFNWSSDFKLIGDKTERLVRVCKEVCATEYYTGPSARGYIDEELFYKEGIKVKYMDYSNYPEYKQLYDAFIHEVSILDLIFNEGSDSKNFLKSTIGKEVMAGI